MGRVRTCVIFGEELDVADLAELAGITTSAVHVRLNKGMSPLAVAVTPKVQAEGVEMIGARFGRLVVLSEEPEKTAAGKRRVRCQCDCGSTTVVVGADLRSGRTISCGCAKREATAWARMREAEDITGQTFADGGVTVLGPGDFALVGKGGGQRRRVRQWRCRCRCGKLFQAKAAALKKGQVTSCGCRKVALTSERMKATALRYNFFGERLTLAEIAEATGMEAPTIAYRMRRLGMSAEQAATTAPLRRLSERPRGRRGAAREAA